MSSINMIRESVDVKLDKLNARANAFQAALEGTQAELKARVAQNKQEAQRALAKLTADIGNQKDVSDARKQAMRSVAENLNIQIDLSESAARETLASARRQIHDAVRKAETEMDAAFGESKSATVELLHASMGAYARALDNLDAELEAAELRFASAKDKLDAAFDQRRQAMVQEIVKFKQRLGGKTVHASEKLAGFEADLRGGFEQIAKSLKDLFA